MRFFQDPKHAGPEALVREGREGEGRVLQGPTLDGELHQRTAALGTATRDVRGVALAESGRERADGGHRRHWRGAPPGVVHGHARAFARHAIALLVVAPRAQALGVVPGDHAATAVDQLEERDVHADGRDAHRRADHARLPLPIEAEEEADPELRTRPARLSERALALRAGPEPDGLELRREERRRATERLEIAPGIDGQESVLGGTTESEALELDHVECAPPGHASLLAGLLEGREARERPLGVRQSGRRERQERAGEQPVGEGSHPHRLADTRAGVKKPDDGLALNPTKGQRRVRPIMMLRRLGWITLALAGALGCDDGGTTSADAGPRPAILFEELYGEVCTVSGCPGRLLQTACTCVASPLDGFDVNRVGCSELEPEGDVPRTPEADFCDGAGASAAPDLGCFMDGSRPTLGTPELVTMYGVVEIFDIGVDTNEITVDVLAEDVDGRLGTVIGSALALVGDPAGPCVESDTDFQGGEPVAERRLGFYQIPEVPTETPLIVRTRGDSEFWRDVYTYGVIIRNDQVEAAPPADACETVAALEGPLFEYRPMALSTSDWHDLADSARLTDGVRARSGVVLAEVRDCADVRLELAQVGTFPLAVGRAYFDGDATHPRPDPEQMAGTGVLGLWAGLDVPAGQVDVAAIGSTGGQTVSLGWYRARAFAGAVTRVELRGLRANQN